MEGYTQVTFNHLPALSSLLSKIVISVWQHAKKYLKKKSLHIPMI